MQAASDVSDYEQPGRHVLVHLGDRDVEASSRSKSRPMSGVSAVLRVTDQVGQTQCYAFRFSKPDPVTWSSYHPRPNHRSQRGCAK